MINFSTSPGVDAYGRQLRYARFSITDRCNLNCVYCVNSQRQSYIPHKSILRYEECLRLAHVLQIMGIKKIRITGGEPFSRKGVDKFLTDLRKNFPDMQLALTTNATLLEPYLDTLAKLNLSSLNISLDTFDPEEFEKLTGKNLLPTVLSNLEKLLKARLPVKLNAVAISGITDKRIDDFLHAAKNLPLDMRFIEFMPMGNNTAWQQDMFLSTEEIKAAIQEKIQLSPVGRDSELAGPARMFQPKGYLGRIGFISAISNHFCSTCQRLRITSDGKLRLCLFSDKEIRLAPILRNKILKDRHLKLAIANSLAKKPLGVDLLNARAGASVADCQMVGIGG